VKRRAGAGEIRSLLAPFASNAPLASSGTCGSIFAGGLWDPKGVRVPVGGIGRSGERVPASALSFQRRPRLAVTVVITEGEPY
jgi:hypothetical protein